jgi:lysophospholipase L1-like esterase
MSFQAVVVLAGTNDFSCDHSLPYLLSLFTAMITHIRAVNPTAQIGICGILPRPCDARHPSTHHRIKERIQFNTALLLHCQASGVAYFKTDKAFKGKGSDSYLFHTDYLHLSDNGLYFLKKWLEGRIACLIGDPQQATD